VGVEFTGSGWGYGGGGDRADDGREWRVGISRD